MNRSTLVALLLPCWACSFASRGLSMPASSPVRVALSQPAGTLVFPSSGGYSPTAAYQLSREPVAGTNVMLSTLAANAPSLPKTPAGATVLVAMQLTASNPLVLNRFPVWAIGIPSNVSPSTPVGIEAFDGNAKIGEYAATVDDGRVRSVAFGANVSMTAGHTYTYVLEQNPALGRFPRGIRH